MDPISITVGAASLAKLAFNLVQMLNSTKGVDATLQAFSGEIKTLAETLGLIDSAFQEPKLRDVDSQARVTNVHLSKVFDSLRKIMTDCEDTLVKLDTIIQRSTSSIGFKNAVFRRSVTTLKLNFNGAEIALLKQQIQSYISAMQMTLSIVNMSIVLSQNQSTSSFLSELRDGIGSLQRSRGILQNDIASSHRFSQEEISRQKLKNLDQFVQVSGSILSGATTYYGSLDGSVTSDFDRAGVGVGSTVGLNPAQRSKIESWRGNQSVDPVNEESFEVRLNNRRLELAGRKRTQDEFSDAEDLLKTFLSNAEDSEHPDYQILEAKMTLALCYESQKKFNEAIELLRLILDSGELSNEQKFHTMHRLAESYLKDSNAEEALPLATAACKGRYNLQRDELYYESCILVANIHSALGHRGEAELYLEDLPPSYRQGHSESASNQVSSEKSPATQISVPSLTPQHPFPVQPAEAPETKIPEWPFFIQPKLSRSAVNRVGSSKSSESKGPDSPPPDPLSVTTPTSNPESSSRLPKETEPGSGAMIPGKLYLTLSEHVDNVRAIAIGPNGRTLISTENKALKFWNIAADTAQIIRVTKCVSPIYSVAVSGTGKTIASGSADGTLLLWNAENGTPRTKLEGHSYSVLSVAFSADGRTLASGSFDKTIKVWDVATGNLQKTLSGHKDIVTTLAFSSSGDLLASGSFDGNIMIWKQYANWNQLKIFPGNSNVHSVAFSPDRRAIASAHGDCTIKCWDFSSGELTTVLNHSHVVASVAFLPDGRNIASSCMNGSVTLWNVETRTKRLIKDTTYKYATIPVAVGGNVFAFAYGKTVEVWAT